MNGTINSYQAIRNGVRTYGELVKVARPSSSYGTCCACHKYGIETWQLSTRASICRACCERKADEVLGSIVKAERAARSYVKRAMERGVDITKQLRFYAHLSRASEDYILAEHKRQSGVAS
jgi:hypothetical protein